MPNQMAARLQCYSFALSWLEKFRLSHCVLPIGPHAIRRRAAELIVRSVVGLCNKEQRLVPLIKRRLALRLSAHSWSGASIEWFKIEPQLQWRREFSGRPLKSQPQTTIDGSRARFAPSPRLRRWRPPCACSADFRRKELNKRRSIALRSVASRSKGGAAPVGRSPLMSGH